LLLINLQLSTIYVQFCLKKVGITQAGVTSMNEENMMSRRKAIGGMGAALATVVAMRSLAAPMAKSMERLAAMDNHKSA
jgi:hypothetical protein